MMKKLWRKLKKWWEKMWGLNIHDEDMGIITEEDLLVGAVYDTIDIPGGSTITIDFDNEFTTPIFSGGDITGWLDCIKGDSSITIKNRSNATASLSLVRIRRS